MRSKRAGDFHLSAPAAGRRGGFTLVELLLCIAIIMVLLSFLFPTLLRARESARATVCRNNLHQLMNAFIAFATDHEDQLPGGHWDTVFKNNPDSDHWDWLRGDPWDWTTSPQGGTLFRYVGQNAAVYRCPSLEPNPPAPGATAGPFTGSNGRYDYVSMSVFVGARLNNIQLTSKLTYADGHQEFQPTPIIVEGPPILLNGVGVKDTHAGEDFMATTHRGGANYAARDGSIQWIIEPPGGCAVWSSQTPHGVWSNYANAFYFWGSWNRR